MTGSALSAFTVMSPVPALTCAPPRTVASVRVPFTMLSASEPATPTFFEPAPDLAVAVMVWFLSPATSVMTASTSRPFEVIVVLPVVAVFLIST